MLWWKAPQPWLAKHLHAFRMHVKTPKHLQALHLGKIAVFEKDIANQAEERFIPACMPACLL